MALENSALVLDLVEWVAKTPRPYTDVMEVWRTSCPRLSVWEEALAHDLVVRRIVDGEAIVTATAQGRALLVSEGRGN